MSEISVDALPATSAPFRMGVVFSKTFAVFGRQFGKFILLTFIPMALLLVTVVWTLLGTRTGSAASTVAAVSALTGILTFILQIVAQATALYGAFQEMRGQPFTIAQSLGVGFRRALPVLCVALLSGLLAILAGFLLIIPGIIVGCMLYVAVPVCVIEKPGIFASLGRSAALTRGYRWSIFGLWLIVVVVSAVAAFILGRLGGTVAGPLLQFVWQLVATAFGAVLASVVYHDLRVAKEGIDIEDLANVFD